MDNDRLADLRRLYKDIPEQQLIDMLSEDEQDYEIGAYRLLIEEAKRRGLEDKLDEIKRAKEEREKLKTQKEYKFIKAYTTPKAGEIAIIKSILDAQNLVYYIKGENFGILYGPADGLSSMDVMVREDNIEDAKELLKDFIHLPPR
jgi:hypothetical protein